ncbi:uncharacterized protein LOC114942159 [Nylanderia fulva]|uniref:uncharacterized protein LOC114942159 n=1 Tax=Nylanderia fulva TaxID=613905 RepID=UPI0010FB3676|nr:uncharacterized protein LOC114942159 [Nylanderia fulva]
MTKSVHEETTSKRCNETLHKINYEPLHNSLATPQRCTVRSTRKLLFNENDMEKLTDIDMQCESTIDCVNNSDNTFSSKGDNSDSSIQFHKKNDKKKLTDVDMQCENNIDCVSNSDNTFNSKSDNSDSSIQFHQKNVNLQVQKKFSILQGRFHIQRNIIFNEYEIINRDKIREIIQYNMVHLLHFLCPLKFYGGIRRNSDCLVAYAKCRYISHVQQFKFDIENLNNAIVDVFVSSTKCTEILHKGPPIFLNLKGESRDQAKLKMNYISPRMLQLKILENVDHELANDGYFEELRRLSTYQKTKSEENKKNDSYLSSYDLSDLFQKYIIDQESNDPYIRNVSLPFHVYNMYTEEQINVLDKNDIIIHFDATGSIIRKPKGIKCKRILYYAIVVNKNGTILPVAKMITAVHDINAISIFLKTFRHFLRTKRFSWPLFSVIVVDWSWALINAIMNEWNTLTVSQYLEEVYITLNKKEIIRSNLIVVHSCCAHFQKRISSTISNKFSKSIKNKSLILECMGILIHCNTLDDLDYCYEKFMIILLTSSNKEAHNIIVLSI